MEDKGEELSKVLNSINQVTNCYIGNSNSIHSLGTNSKKLELAATEQIADLFKFVDKDIIYTSGICESNNLVIYGVLKNCKSLNKTVYALNSCNSSIIETLKSFAGDFNVLFVDDVKSIKVDKETVLVCFSSRKDAMDFKKLNDEFQNHILLDMTDDISFDVDLSFIDFLTFDLSKYDLYGIGVLIKDRCLNLEPLFRGGKSTTSYRSGTPFLPLIVAFSKYLRFLYEKK